MSKWLSGVAASMAASVSAISASVMKPSYLQELNTQWASIRRYFQTIDQSADGDDGPSEMLRDQIPELEEKFRNIEKLLKEEYRLYKADGGGRAICDEVFDTEGSGDVAGMFVHACTFAKTAYWPELKAAVMRFLVNTIVAADAYEGTLLTSREVVDPLVDVLGNARADIDAPVIQEAVSSMVELICRTATAEPKVLDVIRPTRARLSNYKGSNASFIIEMTTSIIDRCTSSRSLQRSLDSFGFMLLACPEAVPDSLVDQLIKTVTIRMGQQLMTVCSMSSPDRQQLMEMFLHGIRFLNFLSLTSPRVVPLVRPAVSDMADRLASLLTSPNDIIFQAAASATLAAARASSQPAVRHLFGLLLLREPVVTSLFTRCFDPCQKKVAPAAVIALAGAFEVVPLQAFRKLIVGTDSISAAPSSPTFRAPSAISSSFGDYISHHKGQTVDKPAVLPAPVTVPPVSMRTVRNAKVICVLSERLSTAYDQPEEITASCILLALQILALPSADIWGALLGQASATEEEVREAPLAAVIATLCEAEVGDTSGNGTARERMAHQGMVKALLSTFRTALLFLREEHVKDITPLTIALVP